MALGMGWHLLLAASGFAPGAALHARREPMSEFVERMRATGEDAQEQARACTQLSELVTLTPEQWQKIKPSPVQAEAIDLGADVLVVAAMGRFPNDAEVQVACSRTLSKLAQWNAPYFEVLGQHGAIQAIANAVQSGSDDPKMLGLSGNMASLTDFEHDPRSVNNLERLEETGVAETVLHGMMKFRNSSDVVLTSLCFFSNACAPPKIKAKMIEEGYLEDSVEIMRRSQKMFGIRGEVVWLADKCFSDDEEMRRRQADAGLLEQVVATLQDGNVGRRTDVINNQRMFRNAMHLLKKYALASKEYRVRILEAGAGKEILTGLAKGLAKASDACSCLAALLPAGAAQPEACVRATAGR